MTLLQAQLTSQTFQLGRTDLKKYEKNNHKELDTDIWYSTFVTNIPINVGTYKAYELIDDFTQRHFCDIKEIAISRNGMLGFWEFQVVTYSEITNFNPKDKEVMFTYLDSVINHFFPVDRVKSEYKGYKMKGRYINGQKEIEVVFSLGEKEDKHILTAIKSPEGKTRWIKQEKGQ